MYKYIYPVKYLKQKDLEGRNHTFKQICGPGHLILELATQPLCHAEDVCMGGGDGTIIRERRDPAFSICPKCQEIYKKRDHNWITWVNACSTNSSTSKP